MFLYSILIYCSSGDKHQFELPLHRREVMVFTSTPQSLLDKYYVPLSANFPAVDALTKEAALQCCVTDKHPVKGVQTINALATLYPEGELILVFVVPESIVLQFKRQPIQTAAGKNPRKLPRVRQFVAGLPLGIDTSLLKKRRIT